MLRSQSQDLLLRGLSQDLVFCESKRVKPSTRTLQNISRVLRPFRSAKHGTDEQISTRGLESSLFRAARRYVGVMCICILVGRLAILMINPGLQIDDMESVPALPSEERDILQDAAAAAILNSKPTDGANHLGARFAPLALAPLAPVPTAAEDRILATEPPASPTCREQNQQTRFKPIRSTNVLRAYDALRHHHMLRFQHHRARHTSVGFSGNQATARTLQQTIPESAAPSLAETERILRGDTVIALPMSMQPNFEQTVRLVVERIQSKLSVE
jgi:hypothetical protein